METETVNRRLSDVVSGPQESSGSTRKARKAMGRHFCYHWERPVLENRRT